MSYLTVSCCIFQVSAYVAYQVPITREVHEEILKQNKLKKLHGSAIDPLTRKVWQGPLQLPVLPACGRMTCERGASTSGLPSQPATPPPPVEGWGGLGASGAVGHRDLWEQILWERERAGECVQLRWIPSHLGLPGNHGAALAETGRQQHHNNDSALPKRRRLREWEESGLVEMSSEEERSGSDVDSGNSWDEGSSGGGASSPTSTEVSEGCQTDSSERDSGGLEFSTAVSDTRRVRVTHSWPSAAAPPAPYSCVGRA